MMKEFEKSLDDNQPPRRGRGRQPHCWARRESGVSRGTGGGIMFGKIPIDKRQSAAAGGVSRHSGGGGVSHNTGGGGVGRGARGGSASTLVASFFLSFSS